MITECNEVRPVNTEHYFGACPKCGNENGFMNIGRNHWNVCDAHKTKWPIGSNLFSCWLEESTEDWERNAKVLDGYEEVEPLPMEPDDEGMYSY